MSSTARAKANRKGEVTALSRRIVDEVECGLRIMNGLEPCMCSNALPWLMGRGAQDGCTTTIIE